MPITLLPTSHQETPLKPQETEPREHTACLPRTLSFPERLRDGL